MLLCHLLTQADLYTQKNLQEILSGTLSKCQTVWIKIRTDIMLVLIWIQTVCKSYQQVTKFAASNLGKSYEYGNTLPSKLHCL